jgi:hypothetical protein
MLRALMCSFALLAFLVAGTAVQAQNKQNNQGAGATKEKSSAQAGKNKKGHEATITNVNAKKGTVTVKMKGKNGKEVEKTFKLTEDVRMFDSTGRAAVIDVFQSGNEVLVIEAEGRLRELHKKGANANKSKTNSK